MKQWQFYTTLTLSILCLISSLVWIGLTYTNQTKLTQLQEQQSGLRQHQVIQQITGSVIQQLAQASLKNDNIRKFLTQHHITLTPRQSDSTTSGTR